MSRFAHWKHLVYPEWDRGAPIVPWHELWVWPGHKLKIDDLEEFEELFVEDDDE